MSATRRICPPGYQAGVASTLVLERPEAVPDAPGSYQFKDADGRVIYVGKARSLRARLATYFQDPRQLHPRTAQMLERAASVEWIQVRSDVEAIMLEYNLIKAAPAALQRAPRRRQELPVPGGHRRRASGRGRP